MTKIPVYDNRTRKIIETVDFKPNLDVFAPRYKNEGCSMGLTRDTMGRLVLMYKHEEFPGCDNAVFISEEEGYELCLNRGKQCLAEKLQIEPRYNGE